MNHIKGTNREQMQMRSLEDMVGRESMVIIIQERDTRACSVWRSFYSCGSSRAYHMSGDFQDRTVEQDWESIEELRACENIREQIDVLEWTLPDPAVEDICMNAAWLGVRMNDGSYEVFDGSASIDDGSNGD